MRYAITLLALPLVFAASPALAKQDAWYIGIEGGSMIVEDLRFDVGSVSDGRSVNSNYGWDVDGTIGYDFGGFRAEVEVGYRRATLDGIDTIVPTYNYNGTGTYVGTSPPGSYPNATGRTSALDFMINGLVDVGKDDQLQGFFGAGAGIAKVKGDYSLAPGSDFFNASQSKFAVQGIAGLRFPISDNLNLGARYQLLYVPSLSVDDGSGTRNDFHWISHSLVADITFDFK